MEFPYLLLLGKKYLIKFLPIIEEFYGVYLQSSKTNDVGSWSLIRGNNRKTVIIFFRSKLESDENRISNYTTV